MTTTASTCRATSTVTDELRSAAGGTGPAAPGRTAAPGSGPAVAASMGAAHAGLGDADRRALRAVLDVATRLAPDALVGVSCGVHCLLVPGGPLIGVTADRAGLSVVPFSRAVLDAVRGDLGGFAVSRTRIRFSGGRPLPRRVVARLVSLRRAEIGGAVVVPGLDGPGPRAQPG